MIHTVILILVITGSMFIIVGVICGFANIGLQTAMKEHNELLKELIKNGQIEKQKDLKTEKDFEDTVKPLDLDYSDYYYDTQNTIKVPKDVQKHMDDNFGPT